MWSLLARSSGPALAVPLWRACGAPEPLEVPIGVKPSSGSLFQTEDFKMTTRQEIVQAYSNCVAERGQAEADAILARFARDDNKGKSFHGVPERVWPECLAALKAQRDTAAATWDRWNNR